MGNILVCVTGQRTCEKLIREGAKIADARHSKLFVLHVMRTGEKILGQEDSSEALEFLFRVSGDNNAEMNVVRSDDVPGAIAGVTRRNGIDTVVLGVSDRSRARRLNPASTLRYRLPDVEFVELITGE